LKLRNSPSAVFFIVVSASSKAKDNISSQLKVESMSVKKYKRGTHVILNFLELGYPYILHIIATVYWYVSLIRLVGYLLDVLLHNLYLIQRIRFRKIKLA
jgi:hypothetical protein